MTKSSLQTSDDEAQAVQKTANRISLKSMEDKVERVEYIYPETAKHFTIAIVRMANGYLLVGKSAPADPENFDRELGQKFAYEDAIRQLWPLEGYALREKLSAA